MRELAESGLLGGERGRQGDPGSPARSTRSGSRRACSQPGCARSDRLPAPVKRVLQVAAATHQGAAGEHPAMVAAMEENALDAALRELTPSGFLYEAEIYPERVLAFRHPLTQEVAYGSEPPSRVPARRAHGSRPDRARARAPRPGRAPDLPAPCRRRAQERGRLPAGPPAGRTGPATAIPRTRCASGPESRSSRLPPAPVGGTGPPSPCPPGSFRWTTPGGSAWRSHAWTRCWRKRVEIATRTGDLRSQAAC